MKRDNIVPPTYYDALATHLDTLASELAGDTEYDWDECIQAAMTNHEDWLYNPTDNFRLNIAGARLLRKQTQEDYDFDTDEYVDVPVIDDSQFDALMAASYVRAAAAACRAAAATMGAHASDIDDDVARDFLREEIDTSEFFATRRA